MKCLRSAEGESIAAKLVGLVAAFQLRNPARGGFRVAPWKSLLNVRVVCTEMQAHMFQVTFSDQSLHEINKLDQFAQLELIEPLGSLTKAQLEHPREPLGKFSREGHTFFRLRSGNYRFYFEENGDQLNVRWVLHKDSLEDFLFRTKLPVSDEQLFEQHSKFWKYLESLAR